MDSTANVNAAPPVSGVSEPSSGEENLLTLMMSALSGQADVLQQITDMQSEKIQYRNTELENLNAAKSQIDALAANDETYDLAKQNITITDPKTGQSVTESLQKFLTDEGVPLPTKSSDTKQNQTELQTISANIDNKISSVSSSSQTDIIELQATINKYNQTYETMSSFVSKYDEALETIAGNLQH